MPGRELLCMPVLGHSGYPGWVVTMSMLGKPLLRAGRCLALFLFPPAHGQLARNSGCSFFCGVSLLRASRCEPTADGAGGSMWLHLWLRLPEWGIGYCALAQPRASVSCSLRRMYQRTEVNENLPEQNLRKVKRQACNDASSPGWVYVLCLK